MKQVFKHGIAVACLLMMSGCSFLSPVKTGPDSGYVINTMPCNVHKSHWRSAVLLVLSPETNPVYNTKRIAFTIKPYQISYYSTSRWIEAPADMLTPLLMQTMQQTNRYKTVVSPPFTGAYNYALRTQIKTLLVDYTCGTPVLRLALQEQIIGANSGRVIASRSFSTAVPLRQKSPYGAVVAANRATAKLLGEIAAWSVKHTR